MDEQSVESTKEEVTGAEIAASQRETGSCCPEKQGVPSKHRDVAPTSK